jgi:hypothetical protein
MALLLVASFSKPEDAHLLRLRLEAGGVPAHVQDENTIQMDWLLSNAIGGVRVMVEEEDADRVREILAEEPVEGADSDRPACPDCLSTHTAPDEGPRRFAFLTLATVGFPLFLHKHRWKCTDCGRSWDERKPA